MKSLRGALRRLTAFAAALAFSATATAALGAHACPHHDGLPAAPSDAAHAGHGAQDGADGTGHEAPCTCVGACATSAPVALPAAPVVRAAEAAVPTIASNIESSTAAVPSTVAYLLPFANAPPTR